MMGWKGRMIESTRVSATHSRVSGTRTRVGHRSCLRSGMTFGKVEDLLVYQKALAAANEVSALLTRTDFSKALFVARSCAHRRRIRTEIRSPFRPLPVPRAWIGEGK